MFFSRSLVLFITLAVVVAEDKILEYSVQNVSDKIVLADVVNKTYSVKTGRESLQNSLTVYEPEVIRNLSAVQNNMSLTCYRDMMEFVSGLDQQKLWALKMLDATGRYSSGFFWGNNYWLGSATLCENIENVPKHFGGQMTVRRDLQQHRQQSSLPFQVGFYRIKTQIRYPSVDDMTRYIHLGLCIPTSCTEDDVKLLVNVTLESRRKMANQTSVQVLDVRTPHYSYLFYQDPIFWGLFVVCFVIGSLLAAGTTYDYYYERKKKNNIQFRFPCSQEYRIEEERRINVNITNNLKSGNVNLISNVLQRLRGEGNKFDDNLNNVPSSDSDNSSVRSDYEKGLWHQFLLSFSIRINMRTICDQSVGADTIPTIHGLRSISMVWVILGHTCIIAFKYSDNMEFRTIVEKEFLFQTVSNGVFSVDTFFFISGLLVSFLYFRTTSKIDIRTITGADGFTSNVLEFVGLLAYRFCRLTAPYIFVLGTVLVSMKWFYYNSVFDPPTDDHVNCAQYWWRNVLYINTLFPVNEMCMLWSWYLADDTQFYVLGVILLIIASSRLKLAGGLLIFFLISSWLTTGYIAYINNHSPSLDDPLALFDKIYDKPWTRLGPYLIGMAVGWFLFKTDCKFHMSKPVVVIGWLVSMAGMSSLVYGLYEAHLDRVTSAAYSSLSHSAWAIGLAWMVVACSTGYGGFVNKLLSTSLLYPFSRVTYCAYLVHPMVIRFMVISTDSPLHLSKVSVMIMFFGQVIASYILSFIVSLAFEAPLVSLLRIAAPKKK